MCLVLSIYYCEDNYDNGGQLFVWQLKPVLSELSVLSSYLFKTTMITEDNFSWCKIVCVVFIYIYDNRGDFFYIQGYLCCLCCLFLYLRQRWQQGQFQKTRHVFPSWESSVEFFGREERKYCKEIVFCVTDYESVRYSNLRRIVKFLSMQEVANDDVISSLLKFQLLRMGVRDGLSKPTKWCVFLSETSNFEVSAMIFSRKKGKKRVVENKNIRKLGVFSCKSVCVFLMV